MLDDPDHDEKRDHDSPRLVERAGTQRETGERRRLRREEQMLGRNRLGAERNRGFFDGRRVLALNFVGSPGSGKTSLLERSIANEGIRRTWFVVQGDPATEFDAERVRRKGARAAQLNTGTVSHLDAAMVARAIAALDPRPGGIVAIENVGNLVCPALFDLGEHARVVVASVTEGDDKPAKYPTMFRSASLVVLNKIDLLPYVDFDVGTFAEYVRDVNPDVPILQISAARGDGMATWYRWLDQRLSERGSLLHLVSLA
ncbi:MAG TPA: hydrogenase nickel incorporation protein HypB [Polyangiaceae bacterium]|nr:hydrogenase nickel incorporation protein HypB [Polyangiaceae bacterium]